MAVRKQAGWAPARRGARAPSRRRYAAGEERRQALIDAALRIIGREGLAAVTHRAVAREAGTSIGPTTYHFESKADMIRAALRSLASRSLERVDAMAEALERGGPPSNDAAIRAIVSIVFSELAEGETEAEIELILAIAREPDFAPEYQTYQRAMESRLERLMRAIGASSPSRAASIVLAYTRGFEVEQLARGGDRISRRRFRTHVAHLIEGLCAL